MAHEKKYISLRDILKNDAKLNCKYSPSEFAVVSDDPCIQTLSILPPPPLPPPPSAISLTSSSSDVPENSTRNSLRGEVGKKKGISAEDMLPPKNGSSSGISYKGKGKLLAAPVSSLKRTKSDGPLVYQTLEGNGGTFILNGVEISVNISSGSWDERRFKLALLYVDAKDEEELQVKEEDEGKPGEDEKGKAGENDKEETGEEEPDEDEGNEEGAKDMEVAEAATNN